VLDKGKVINRRISSRTRMKKWSLILATALTGAWCVSLISDFSVAVQYFSSEPRRLLYVVGLAVAGGLAFLIFAQLSHQAQRRCRLFAGGSRQRTYIVHRLSVVSDGFAVALAGRVRHGYLGVVGIVGSRSHRSLSLV
jgi:hypothetical protein